MRWSKVAHGNISETGSRTLPGSSLVVLLLLAFGLLLSGSPDERRISVYSTVANYSLPVVQRDGVDYIGLLEILEPLGTVSAKANPPHWKFRFEDAESDFITGKSRAHVRGSVLDLSSNFLLENGRGLVPLASLHTLLARVLGGPVTLNLDARRLFVGNVAVHFTAQVSKAPPQKLVISFTAPVNPMIGTEPGKLRMVFAHEPVVAPGAQLLTFDSKTIPSATFHESNGSAELVVNSTTPVLASFSNDGRTITIAPPATAAAPAQAATPTVTEASSPTLLGSTSPAGIHHYFAVVDASHGGDESGAVLTVGLMEKDVTLAVARRLRQELETRGLPTTLLRDSDATLTLDQRASVANSAEPAIYICVHASSQGSGVRLYTALLPAGVDTHAPFVDWNSAQGSFQGASQTAESGVAAELRNKGVQVRTGIAPLRPLNNITAAALAIEVAPPGNDISQLNSPAYQQTVASAAAAGLADVRGKLPPGGK